MLCPLIDIENLIPIVSIWLVWHIAIELVQLYTARVEKLKYWDTSNIIDWFRISSTIFYIYQNYHHDVHVGEEFKDG